MECDVAVLGGGPGGYTAAIRAAQLGAKTVCIEQEPELGGTCLRVGCIPTKAWVETAHGLKVADETFAQLGVKVGAPQLDFAAANDWKNAVSKQMTGGVAILLKANGVEWVKGKGAFKDATTIGVEGGEDVTFTSAIVATGSYPVRPPIPGLESPRCVDSTGTARADRGSATARRPRWRHHRLRVRVDPPALRLGGDDRRDARHAHPAGGRGRDEGARQAVRQARDRAPPWGKQCTKVEEGADGLTVHFGEGETVQADLMLVSVGRAPLVEGLGLEQAGVEFDPRKGIAADDHRRDTRAPHLRGRRLRRLLAAGAHGVPRGGDRSRERHGARGRDGRSRRPSPHLHRSRDRRRGPDRGPRRGSEHGDDVAVGRFPWAANAPRAVMQNETVGWVKSIHESKYGELLGVVMVGPHVTDLIEAAVVALDAEATVETVADGMAAHPTLSEAFKEAGLVALGRPIHVGPRRRAATPAQSS